MKKLVLLSSMLFVFIATSVVNANTIKENSGVQTAAQVQETDEEMSRDTKIQVAILLDTSSSMNGLIEQAKSRLWNIVNTITTLRFNGRTPSLEIAIYEYGNDNIPRSKDYIRQVTPMTADLDLISEKLFALTTYGGDEYCGAVIDRAVKELDWGNNTADMKLIYIAGNEPFTQGKVSYKSVIERALAKEIYVHTIHCGSADAGISGMWRDGAIRGKGNFFNINHNAKVRYYDTPYDDRISECNMRLNTTYISYGQSGHTRKQNQIMQDRNAKTISSSNLAERAVSKSATAYNNKSWDLVDRFKYDKDALTNIRKAELPEELQNKSAAELQKLVTEKETERVAIQKEITELAKKRQAYIDEQSKKEENTEDDLGKAINESLLALANQKGYVVGK